MRPSEVHEIINRHTEVDGRISGILGELQAKYRYLPEEALEQVAQELDLPLTQLYGVATFYAAFSLVPKGEHIISVCHGTACHVKGAEQISERLEQVLGVKEGETTADGRFTLESVRCLGCCSLAPVVAMDGKTYGRMKPEQIPELVAAWEGEKK